MPVLYFSKFNVNSNIYEVRKGKISIEKILDELFNKINDEEKFKLTKVNSFLNEDGELEEETIVDDEYIFSELEKNHDEKYIAGKIVRMYPIFGENYNEDTKKTEKVVHNNSSSITFFFDLNKEIIAFYTKRNFKYEQFNTAFKGLADKFMAGMEFEVFLHKNSKTLFEELKKFNKITSITATIIPANAANDEDLDKLRKSSEGYIAKLEEAGITKQHVIYYASNKNEYGINAEADIIKSTFIQSTNGYGNFIAEGEDKKGNPLVFNSDEGAPYTSRITDVEKDNFESFKDIAKKHIARIRAKMVTERG